MLGLGPISFANGWFRSGGDEAVLPTNTCGGVSWRPLDKSSSDKNKGTHKKLCFLHIFGHHYVKVGCSEVWQPFYNLEGKQRVS